jgi:hypothetical protein
VTYVTASNQSVLNVTVTRTFQRAIASDSAFGKQFMLDLHRMLKDAVKVDGVKRINLYVVGSEFKIADAETDDTAENKVRIRLVIP